MIYLPLARKHRPQTFAGLVGQPHVTTTLTRALQSKRLGQAYLFAGMRGVGKTSAARIFAKCLNCERGPTPAPCDRCGSCTHIIQGASLDVIEIDGASNRGIDEIRTLRETVPFAPTSGSFRIYIIDEVHMLTTEAFNALLKTLEEPPAHVKFIFATTAVNKVPATILSRCQRFDFRRIETATLVDVLTRVAQAEQIGISEPALYAIARAADGSLRDAEVILEQLRSFAEGSIDEPDVTGLLGAVESDALFAWAQAILDRNAPEALRILLQQIEQGKDAQQLLAGLLRHLRNLLMLRSTKGVPARDDVIARLVDEPAERLERLDGQADPLTMHELLLLVQILVGAYELVRRSPMAQTILELTVMKLATREAWQSLGEISRRLERLSGITPSAEAPPTSGPSAPPTYRPAPSSSSPATSPSHAAASAATPVSVAPSLTEEHATPPHVPSRAADPEPSGISSPEGLAEVWPVFLERLGERKMSLAAYLADARPVRLERGALTVGLPGFALHQEVLSVAENRRLIAGLLSELFRASITVQYTTLPASLQPASGSPDSPSAADRATPPLVQDIVKVFNATLLDRPRTSP
ncbi:MAG: DNA polymerase III subunit gamma/tau [Candidatus Omnitrophica bacterium]|nr:DNA polymerase III subunit gamma/tau [Candidatus Omnitrophota bacterium]MBI3020651.1 DNA polymerase III subunit gamma/tau [Candidatus Omnitrophota bacterium]